MGAAIRIFVLSPFMLIPILAAAAVAMTPVWVWLRRRAAGKVSTLDHQILGGCVFTGIWLSLLATRRDVAHLIFVLPLLAYLIPGILDLQTFSTQRLRELRVVLAGYMVIAFAPLALVIMQRGTSVETKFGAVITSQATAETIQTLERTVGSSKTLYVHPYQPFLYALTGTENPTEFAFLFPGMYPPELFDRAVQQLRAERTRFVLLDADWPVNVTRTWPSISAEALASDPVSNYILKNYRLCMVLAREGAYRYYLMAHKDAHCSP
jgi:hypothetical protein